MTLADVTGSTARARSRVCVVQHEHGWFFTERVVDIEMLGDVSARLLMDPRQLG